MGNNYYAVRSRPTVREPIHIGKSSYGWLFLFHEVYEPDLEPPVVWRNYAEVKDWLKRYTVDSNEYVIMDEYDCIISYDDFFAMVDEKQKDEFNLSNPDNFRDGVYNRGGYRFDPKEFW